MNFPMMSRACFGMYGSYFVVIIKCFVNFIFFGIQSYWGGLAMDVMLSAISPSFHNMKNTLPERFVTLCSVSSLANSNSANITTPELIGTIVYMVIFYCFLFVPPYKLPIFFRISFYMVLTTIVGMFIWAMVTNKGPGNLLRPTTELSAA